MSVFLWMCYTFQNVFSNIINHVLYWIGYHEIFLMSWINIYMAFYYKENWIAPNIASSWQASLRVSRIFKAFPMVKKFAFIISSNRNRNVNIIFQCLSSKTCQTTMDMLCSKWQKGPSLGWLNTMHHYCQLDPRNIFKWNWKQNI